jgi:hypothetical protein
VRGSNTGIASYADKLKSYPENPDRTPGFLAEMAARQRLFGLVSEGMVLWQLPNWDTKMGEVKWSYYSRISSAQAPSTNWLPSPPVGGPGIPLVSAWNSRSSQLSGPTRAEMIKGGGNDFLIRFRCHI